MLKSLDREYRRQPLVAFYQRILLSTHSRMLQEQLIHLFELNQWELPDPYNKKPKRETLDEI